MIKYVLYHINYVITLRRNHIMKKFDGILIVTDLDGTLLNSKKIITNENIEAIEYFKSEGGYFTFITGRMPSYVSYIYDTTNPNCPFGCINGGGLYDHITQEYVWTERLPDSVVELLDFVDTHAPSVGIQVSTYDKVYFCKENEVMAHFRAVTGVPNLVRHYNDINEPFAKIVFSVLNTDDIPKLAALLDSHPMADNFSFLHSEKYLYEIIPKGIHKGVALSNLAKILNVDVRKSIAIGDYNNDIDMLKTAGIGVAVSNACDELKSIADYITVSNNEHAIAAVIKDLDSGKLKI